MLANEREFRKVPAAKRTGGRIDEKKKWPCKNRGFVVVCLPHRGVFSCYSRITIAVG